MVGLANRTLSIGKKTAYLWLPMPVFVNGWQETPELLL